MPRKKNSLPSEYEEVFPSRLRSLMKESGKTQQELADYLKKTRQAVSYYLDGQTSPDWKNIKKISTYFGVSSDYLLGLTDVKSTSTDIYTLVTSLGLHEKAANSLVALTEEGNSGAPLALLDYLLLLPLDLLENLSCSFIAYVLVKYFDPASKLGSAESDININKIRFNMNLNNFKFPDVPICDLLDYSRFELSRKIVEAGDFTVESGNLNKI